MTINNFTLAIRNFANYFENKELNQINDKTFTNGYLSKNNQENKNLCETLKKEINFEQALSTSNFIQFTFNVFNTFTSDKDNYKDFHLEKENVIVVRFLYKFMTYKGEIGGVKLTEDQINSLKDVYIKVNQVFTENFEHYENLLIKRVDDRVDQHLKTLTQNQNNVNNNERSKESQIKNIIENNFSDFNPIRNLMRRLLKYKNHLTIHNTHLSQKSIHKKQSFENYPEPWLKEDEDYVREYNEIIEKAQDQTLELMIKYTKIRLNKIENQIKEKLSSLENNDNYQSFEMTDIYDFLLKREEGNKKMIDIFLKAINKAKKCTTREFYKATPIDNNRETISFNDSSFDSTTVSNTSRNSRTRHPRTSSKSNQNRSILKRSQSRNRENNKNNYSYNNKNQYQNKNQNEKVRKHIINNNNNNNNNHNYNNYNQNYNNQNYNNQTFNSNRQNQNYNKNMNHQNYYNDHQNFQYQNSNQYR